MREITKYYFDFIQNWENIPYKEPISNYPATLEFFIPTKCDTFYGNVSLSKGIVLSLGCTYHTFGGDAKLTLYASTYLKRLGFTAKLFSFKNPNVEYVDENYDNGIDMLHHNVLNKEVTNPKEILVYITACALHNKLLELLLDEPNPLISGSLVIWDIHFPPCLAAVEELSTLEFDSMVDKEIDLEPKENIRASVPARILENAPVDKLLDYMEFFGDGYDFFIPIKNKNEVLNYNHNFTVAEWDDFYNKMTSANDIVIYYFNSYSPIKLEDISFMTKAQIIEGLIMDLEGTGTACDVDDYQRILNFIKENHLDERYANLFISSNEDSDDYDTFVEMRNDFILETSGIKEEVENKIHNTINEVACLIQDKLGVTHGDETPEQTDIINEAVGTIVQQLVNIALQNKED